MTPANDALATRAAALLGERSIASSEQMERFGERIGALLGAGDLIVLTGPLGAGKTTLTRGIGTGLGVRGPVTSPTFVLARTHPSLVGGVPLVHVDAYRLADAVELDDLDIDFAGSAVIVEWGSGLLDGIAESWLEITIERPRGASGDDVEGDAPRRVSVETRGSADHAPTA